MLFLKQLYHVLSDIHASAFALALALALACRTFNCEASFLSYVGRRGQTSLAGGAKRQLVS
jgi:hypothetical protein